MIKPCYKMQHFLDSSDIFAGTITLVGIELLKNCVIWTHMGSWKPLQNLKTVMLMTS